MGCTRQSQRRGERGERERSARAWTDRLDRRRLGLRRPEHFLFADVHLAIPYNVHPLRTLYNSHDYW